MASHNSKYYAKRLRKCDSKGCATIINLWGNKTPVSSSNDDDACQPDQLAASEKASCTQSQPKLSEPSPKPESELVEPSAKVIVKAPMHNYAKYEMIYPWLYHSGAKGGLMCKYCELFPSVTKEPTMKWVEVGVCLSDHPVRQLDKHQSSKNHQRSLEKFTEATSLNFKKARKPIYQMILSSAKDKEDADRIRNRSVIKKMFSISYFIARKYWAQSTFKDMVNFISSLGVEDLQQHIATAPPDATYLSDTTVSEFINMTAENIERKQLISLREARFFTLLADESTDEKNREQLSIYMKWTQDTTTIPDDHYMGLINVPRTDAESLLNAIQLFCLGKGIDLTRCRFVGFDGANVMSGEVSGLQRRIRHLSPFSLYMNCRNHRLALCLKHLMKHYPLLVEADAVLLAMWKLFHYSPQRFEVFKSIQEAYGDMKVTLVRAAATRWLSHGKACIRFIDRYQACLDALDAIYDAKREPEVFGLRVNVTNKNIISMILLLCDILKPVNVLSLSLQSSTINFMDVESKVKAVCNELESLVTLLQQRDNLLYFSKVDDLFYEIDDRTNLQRRMRQDDHDILHPDDFLERVGIPFINSLKGEIIDAFVCHPVFTAFRALDPRYLPESVAQLPDHGQVWITQLADHYTVRKEDKLKGHTTVCPADIDSSILLKNEYTGFKHQMFMMRQTGRVTTPQQLLTVFSSDEAMKTCFPRIFQLVQLMSIIPTSTAVVERGFSTMNLLCTPLRSTLIQTKLSSLMMICIEGQAHLDDQTLEELCDIFKNSKQRKIIL